jgi:hypothetical protein
VEKHICGAASKGAKVLVDGHRLGGRFSSRQCDSGTSFSDLQAVVHAWQPMQRVTLIHFVDRRVASLEARAVNSLIIMVE